ncbi:hypothetical protein IAR50_000734 [Cryptococcus sp. DSM 104548]
MPPAPSHPSLVWPRSDGDPSRWPQTSAPSNTEWYFQEIPETDGKYGLYEKNAAEVISRHLGLDVDVTKQRIPLPDGYKIYAHRKRQGDGSLRTDYYVYGSTTAPRFRSTREFEQHAIWLFDTSKSLKDHEKCGCPYSRSKKGRQSMPPTLKRPRLSNALPGTLSPAHATPKRPRRSLGAIEPRHHSTPRRRPKASSSGLQSTQQMSDLDDDIEDPERPDIPPTVPDRANELRSGRRFRRGELIWFKCGPFTAPAGTDTQGVGPIRLWPGLVSNYCLRARTLSSETRNGDMTQVILHYVEYQIRPLGLLDPCAEVQRDAKDLMPWLGGTGLFEGGLAQYDLIGNGAMIALRKGAEAAADSILETGAKTRAELEGLIKNLPGWPDKWAKPMKFEELDDWDVIVMRLAYGIRLASRFASCWTQTDKITPLEDDPDMTDEDHIAVKNHEKFFYQGLYWGGERIWLEDMVRVKRLRSELPGESHLLKGSNGSETRCITLLVHKICVVPKRELNAEGKRDYRCVLYGDLYELEELEGKSDIEELVTATGEEGMGQVPVVEAYKPPRGYRYRKINPADMEAMTDLADIAGRVYPDLLDYDTQNWLIDPLNPDKSKSRHVPDDHHWSLMGLRPGLATCSTATVWKTDLTSIAFFAPRQTWTEMKKFYERLLRDRLNLDEGNGPA